MELPFNPIELAKIFMERRDSSRAALISWLKAVQKDGRQVAAVWLRISDILDSGEEIDEKGLAKLFRGQTYPGHRLKGFYGTASMVADGRITGVPWDHFHGTLGSALLHREVARDLTREVLEKLKGKSKGMLNPENRDASIESIHDAVMVLQRELAALDVMIETIQASRDVIH